MSEATVPTHRPHKPSRWLLSIALGVLYLIVALYLFGAIHYDGPFGAASTGNLVLAVVWLAAFIASLLRVRGTFKRLSAAGILAAVVLVPWSFIRPSNDRDWKPEFSQTGWTEIDGDLLTFHNFRNFDYSAEGKTTERWEERSVHLSNLRGIDYFHDAWGGENLAHPILSFDFGPDGPVGLSIETRRESHESFSALGGLFKMFELQYIFGDERDLIRVRTNIRDEPVYLYRMTFPPEAAREILLESLAAQNRLKEHPRFYNVLTQNCTTSLRAQTPAERRRKFDLRMLRNGLLDQYVYEQGGIVSDGLPFSELRPKALINQAARAAHGDPDFSARIREDRPGFTRP